MAPNEASALKKLQRRRVIEYLEKKAQSRSPNSHVVPAVANSKILHDPLLKNCIGTYVPSTRYRVESGGSCTVKTNSETENRRMLPYPTHFSCFPESYEDIKAYLMLGGGACEWDSETQSVSRHMITILDDLKDTMAALKVDSRAQIIVCDVMREEHGPNAAKVQVGSDLFSPYGNIPVGLDIKTPIVSDRGGLGRPAAARWPTRQDSLKYSVVSCSKTGEDAVLVFSGSLKGSRPCVDEKRGTHAPISHPRLTLPTMDAKTHMQHAIQATTKQKTTKYN